MNTDLFLEHGIILEHGWNGFRDEHRFYFWNTDGTDLEMNTDLFWNTELFWNTDGTD